MKYDDQSRFLDGTLDPDLAPRLSMAARALRRELLDGEWHSRSVLISIALKESDVKHKTVSNLIRQLTQDGRLEVEDAPYGKRRLIRLVAPWPR